jgi:hypothetical protein
MYHQKKALQSVNIWKREIMSAPQNRKLLYLYLANDVLQNSKKKTNAFEEAFATILVEVIHHIWRYSTYIFDRIFNILFTHCILYRDLNTKDRGSTSRMIGIWEERKVFSSDVISQLKNITQAKAAPRTPPSPASEPSASLANVGISPELSAKSVFKTLQSLVSVEEENRQNRNVLKRSDELTQEYKRVMEISTDSQALGM